MNLLKLNDDKTEFLILTPPLYKQIINIDHLSVGNAQIISVSSAKNIGVIFDEHLNMKAQIN